MLSRIVAKNFQSWGSLDFNVQSGITLIDGYNQDDGTSEGSGKSSVMNAISWCLFGKIPKDAKVDDVIKHGAKTCGVELHFSTGEVIYRTRKPNDVGLFDAAGLLQKGKDAKETQDLIETYVGLDFETFCQSIYFAQNYDKKFLASNQEEKTKILSSIQNLDVFDKARKEVMDIIKVESNKERDLKHDISTSTIQVDSVNKQIKLIDQNITSMMSSYQTQKDRYVQQIEAKKRELDVLEKTNLINESELKALMADIPDFDENKTKSEINDLASKLLELKTELVGIDQNNKQINDLNKQGESLASQYDKLEDKILKLSEFLLNPSKKCPTCGSDSLNIDLTKHEEELQSLKEDQDAIERTLAEISLTLDGLTLRDRSEHIEVMPLIDKEIEYLNSKLNIFNKHKVAINKLQTSINSFSVSKSILDKSIDETSAQMSSLVTPDTSDLVNQANDLKSSLKDHAEAVKVKTEILVECQKYMHNLEQLKDGFKDIKSFIFNNLLSDLNYRTNKYLKHLFEIEASVKFVNVDQKIETIVNLDGRSTSLGLLSGGQNRRCNLAVDLALSDVISGKSKSRLGILVMDEYFKDLSESSMEKCLDLLKQRKCPVLIIEHNSLFKTIVDNTFQCVLTDGTSYADSGII